MKKKNKNKIKNKNKNKNTYLEGWWIGSTLDDFARVTVVTHTPIILEFSNYKY